MRYGSGRAERHVLDGGTSWGHKRGTTGDHKLGAQAGGTSWGHKRGTTSWGHKLGAQAGDHGGPQCVTGPAGPGDMY